MVVFFFCLAALVDYNESNVTMNLVLFDDAVKHVCRITRIVSNPGGHALLVGVGGSGKRSLTKLAAHMCGYNLQMVKITASYSLNDFKNDLQNMFRRAGVKDEGILFLFLDGQIMNERFLVYMNDLLASGEIPDLFATEDIDAITADVVGKVKAAGLPADRKNCWEYFINAVSNSFSIYFVVYFVVGWCCLVIFIFFFFLFFFFFINNTLIRIKQFLTFLSLSSLFERYVKTYTWFYHSHPCRKRFVFVHDVFQHW